MILALPLGFLKNRRPPSFVWRLLDSAPSEQCNTAVAVRPCATNLRQILSCKEGRAQSRRENGEGRARQGKDRHLSLFVADTILLCRVAEKELRVYVVRPRNSSQGRREPCRSHRHLPFLPWEKNSDLPILIREILPLPIRPGEKVGKESLVPLSTNGSMHVCRILRWDSPRPDTTLPVLQLDVGDLLTALGQACSAPRDRFDLVIKDNRYNEDAVSDCCRRPASHGVFR